MQDNDDKSAAVSPVFNGDKATDGTNREPKANDEVSSKSEETSPSKVIESLDIIAGVSEKRFGRSHNESSDEDEVSGEESDEEEEVPPLLKYTRLNKLPTNFFKRDSISACLFHEDFFAFGTHAGLLHLTLPDFTPIQTVKLHRSSILSIHSDGNYFATGSIDGTVAIGLIEDLSTVTSFDFKRPIQAVVLDSDYKSSATFVSGGMAGEVILSQRNWLGNRIDTVLAKGQGPIMGIFTVDDVILWMNDAGITFCSIHSRAHLLNVPFPTDDKEEARPALYRPHVHFPESDRIIVGWGDHVWMFKVSLKTNGEYGKNFGSILSSAASSLRAVPDKKVELEHYFRIRIHMAGIASFKDDQIMCLGFEVDDIENKLAAKIPELEIIDTVSGEEIYNDEVVSKNYQNLSLNDYHLGKHIGKTSPEYFFISASDCIHVQVFSLKDHFDWYVQRENYLKAWEVGKYAVSLNDRLAVGFQYVDQLITDKQWKNAASFTAAIISIVNNSEDKQVKNETLQKSQDVFLNIIENGEVDYVYDTIPTEPQLDKHLYDAILSFFLKELKLKEFFKCIQKWPLRVFSYQKFEEQLEERIEKHDELEGAYRDAIIHLFLVQKLYSKAIPHMIKRKDIRALSILLTHNLISQFADDILEILLIPYDDTLDNLPNLPLDKLAVTFRIPIDLLVKNRHSLEVSKIVKKLESPKQLRVILFLYLKKLSVIDPDATAPLENDMISLYADYQRDQLLNFLKKRVNYDVERAIEFCSKRKGFHNELIYLWGKIGENKKALSLIIDGLNDPKLAIEFVKSWGDSELWEFMVGYSMDKPKFVKALLDSPDEFGKIYLEVIKAMPTEMHINGLQATLINICRSNALNLQVSENVFKLIDDESKEYGIEYLKALTKGKVININDEL